MSNLKELLHTIDPNFKGVSQEEQDSIVNTLENNPDKMNQLFGHLDPQWEATPQSEKFKTINELTSRDVLPTFGSAFGQGAGDVVKGAGTIMKGAHEWVFGEDKPTPFFDALIQGGKDTSEYYTPKQPYARAVDKNSLATNITRELPVLGATLPLQTMTARPFQALAKGGKFGGLTSAVAENVGAGFGYSGFKYGAGDYKGEDVLDDIAIDTVAGGVFHGVFKALGKVWDTMSPTAKKVTVQAQDAFKKGDIDTATKLTKEVLSDDTVPFSVDDFLKASKPEKSLPDVKPKQTRGSDTGTHYSPYDFETATADSKNWGRTGGIETNNPAEVKSTFFYKKGSKVESGLGVGKKGQYAYDDVDLSKMDIYDPATATKKEQYDMAQAVTEGKFNPAYATTHDDRIKALQKLGYDGWENKDIVEVFSDVTMPKPSVLKESADFAGMPKRTAGMDEVVGAGGKAKPTVTIEATPSSTNPLYDDLVKATPEERIVYEQAHVEPVQRLAKKYNLDVDVEVSLGAYKGQTNPMMAVEIKNAKFRDIGGGNFEVIQQKQIDDFAKEFGQATDQDAVAWYAPVYRGTQEGANGALDLSRDLTDTEWKQLYDVLKAETNDAVTPVKHSGRIDFMNWNGMGDAEFREIVGKAIANLDDGIITSEFKKFDDVKNYIGKENYGDFTEISTGSSRRPNLQGQKSVDGSNQTFSDEVRGIQEKFKTRTPTNPNIIKSEGVGLVAGVEEDEDGNLSYDMVKGLAGVAGTYVAFKTAGALAKAFQKGKVTDDLVEGLTPESKLELFQRVMQDKFNRVKKLINTKANINTIKDSMNIYQKEEMYHGRVADMIREFEDEVSTPLIERIRNAGLKTEEVDKYLHARHAMERNKKMYELNGIENGSGMSDAEATAIVSKYAKNSTMNGIANDVYDMNRNRLKMIREEGLEADDFIKQLEEGYDNYVPLKREFEEGATFTGQNTGKGFDIKGKEFKRAKGSHRKVESPLFNSILDYQETIVRSEKNRVGKSLLDFMEEFPDKSIYEVKGLTHLPQYDDTGKLLSYNPKYQLADNVLHVKVDGKIKEITIHDPALASAMKNLGNEKMGAMMAYAHKAVRFLAGVNTQWNPEFTVSNFQRDIQTAFFNMPEGIKPNRATIFKDVGSAMRGIYRNERGKSAQGNQWSKLYKEMRSEGGTTGWLEQYDVQNLAKKAKKIMEHNEKKAIPRKAFDSFFDLIDNANTAVENSSRLVAYKMARDSGMTKSKSASIAKNLTVNFNRKGEWGTTMNTAYMFYNASIQGSVRMAEALKNPTTQKLVTGLMASSVGLYYYNISQNKEAYDKIPDYIKDTNYIFMNEDGNYQTVKVPYGFNIFKTTGDMIAETSSGDMEAKTLPSRLISSAVNAFSPIGSAPTLSQSTAPTLTRPMVDLELNKNFIGSRIAPESNPYAPQSKPDAHTYFKSVNPTLKKMAITLNEATGGNRHESGMIDVSPESMEYLLEFALGGVGKLANRTYTAIGKTIEGEKVETHTIPFVRQFHHTPREKQSLYSARDLYSKSGTNKLSERERTNYRTWMKQAIKSKTIDIGKGMRQMRDFDSNQALLDFTSQHNIQSYEQMRKNPKLFGEAVKMGIKPNQLKKFLTKD